MSICLFAVRTLAASPLSQSWIFFSTLLSKAANDVLEENVHIVRSQRPGTQHQSIVDSTVDLIDDHTEVKIPVKLSRFDTRGEDDSIHFSAGHDPPNQKCLC
jgi:hypothetical protein